MLVNDSELAENTRSSVSGEPQSGELVQQALISNEKSVQDVKAAPAVQNNQRQPMYIPNSYTKQPQSWRAPQKRQKVVSIGVAVALVVVVLGVLAAVVPTTQGNASTGFGGLFKPVVNSVGVHQDKPALIAAQAATATAVTQDGYDNGNQSYAGVQSNFTLPNGTNTSSIPTAPTDTSGGISSTSTGTLNTGFYDPFSPGQCTYWADYEYHRLTGKTVTWSGNAQDWVYGAQAAGWNVSSTPHLYSIIVLQGGVQNAGYGTGHVGVVEGINSDGSVRTTNWNIVGWGVFSWQTYYPGPGVSFIW
ncbi:CHAP domain-containing protein [Ktedonobacteria bacterium brp13]|nr:CHAP domain-containing protein [Ktedonobacteria bacterium brp13]